MADNQEKEKIQGLCQLGYIDFEDTDNMYGGSWSHTNQPINQETNIPAQWYKTPELTCSTNLSQLRQNNGGYIPKINYGIGAPRCTFIYGGIQPGLIFPGTAYIKGPMGSYNPSYSSDPSLATSVNTGSPQGQAGFSSDLYSLGDEPTIPVNKLGSQYGTTLKGGGTTNPSILTTYNIWELQNLTSDDTHAETLIPKYKIKKDYGYEIDCTASPYSTQSPYQGPFMYQYFDNNTVRACVVSRGNHPAYVQRIFPLSKDLLYNKNENCQIFYPSTNAYADKVSLDPKYGNCSFHLNFQHNETTGHTSQSNNSIIIIRWYSYGNVQEDIDKHTISDFLLYILPTNNPILWYRDPQNTNNWVQTPLDGPTLRDGEINVYVHFAGPVMLVGFTDDPINWHVFNAVQDKYNQHWYPYINANARIAMVINNMTTHFQYSPLTFNNFNQDQAPSGEYLKRNNLYKVFWNFTNYEKTKDNFQKSAYLSDILAKDKPDKSMIRIDDPDDKIDNTFGFGPSYYADWRNIANYNKQLELEKRTSSTTATGQDGQTTTTQTPIYYVGWETTIEGPVFLMVQEEPNKLQKTPSIVNLDKYDLASYLSDWTITYTALGVRGGTIRGIATVTLKDLSLTEIGRETLALIEENTLLITLGAGYDNEPERFFQGLIQGSVTEYNPAGSTTTITCQDIGYTILSEASPRNTWIFMCSRFRDAIKVCFEEAGFTNKYKIETEPFKGSGESDKNLNIRWVKALKQRIGPTMFLVGSPIQNSPSITPQDENGFLDTVLQSFIDSIWDKHVYPALYWDFRSPGKDGGEYLVFTSKQAKIDEIKFYGKDLENMSLPSDRHGVIVNTYTISTDNKTQFAGYYFYSRSPIAKLMSEAKILPSNPPEFAKQQEYPWVGFRRLWVEDLCERFIQTPQALNFMAEVYKENLFKIPWNNINFKVHVVKPLNHWASFNISTFMEKSKTTDLYYYQEVKYEFKKSDNTLTADVTGQNFPRIQV